MTSLIYKIVTRQQWEVALETGVFRGAEVDLLDGFIHFSTATQVAETAAKHFAGRDDLLLVSVDSNALGEKLVWETSRGGALFPHLYAELGLGAVRDVSHITLGQSGKHLFSNLDL